MLSKPLLGGGVLLASNVGAAAALGSPVTVLARAADSVERYRASAPCGIRVEVNTPPVRGRALAESDLVVGAILISTFDALPMITEADLRAMKRGAVIVDAPAGTARAICPSGKIKRQDETIADLIAAVGMVLGPTLPALPRRDRPRRCLRSLAIRAWPPWCSRSHQLLARQ